jgi:hypothetical protein
MQLRATVKQPILPHLALPPSGQLQVRLVVAGEPVRIRPQTRVDRFLSSPRRVDVGMSGGEPGRHPWTLSNGAVA